MNEMLYEKFYKNLKNICLHWQKNFHTKLIQLKPNVLLFSFKFVVGYIFSLEN